MPISSISFAVFRFLLLPALISLLWLYCYPALHHCAFPTVNAEQGPSSQQNTATEAPFRLLVLADPQLEGDTSLPDPHAPSFPSLLEWRNQAREHGLSFALQGVTPTVKEVVGKELPRVLQAYRKRLDLLGNDYYLAHVYRSVKWWTQPTHMVVLGDLLGSQWIDDGEFEERARRFWHRVFKYAKRVPGPASGDKNTFYEDHDTSWEDRLITVVGNHDIGYSGDIDQHRVDRFEQHFGLVNWDATFLWNKYTGSEARAFAKDDAATPKLQLIILNSMNLDEPTADAALREQTWKFLDDALGPAEPARGTIVLTHVPLHKARGVCVDDPMINLFPPEYGGGIREQNHLRQDTSMTILDRLGPQSIILNGHDHEGCHILHFKSGSTANDTSWTATPVHPRQKSRMTSGAVHEITVRSMMGSFGGNAGFLSAWYDVVEKQWRFEYGSCMLGVQHYWWACHGLAVVEMGLLVGSAVAYALERRPHIRQKSKLQ